MAATTTLFHVPESCGRVTLIALEQIGLSYDLRLLNKRTGDHTASEYRAINPKGKVPCLVVDDRTLTETPVIALWLDKHHPQAGLLPADETDRIDAMSVMAWVASGIHPFIFRMRFPGQVSSDPASHTDVQRLAKEQLSEAFAVAEQRLEGQKWLFGDWSIADAHLSWAWWRATGSGLDPSTLPLCAEHTARLFERAAVRRALERERGEVERLEAAGADFGLQPAPTT